MAFNTLEGIKVDTDLLIDDHGYSVDDYSVDCCATLTNNPLMKTLNILCFKNPSIYVKND